MANSEDRKDLGYRGERIEEGYNGEVRKGHNAASTTTNRELPKGGSGTAPPKNQGTNAQGTDSQDKK